MTVSNVPQIIWTPQGPQVPTASAVLAGVRADLNAAFGTTFNFVNASTPQSQLASSYTQNIVAAYAAILWLVNNINPNVASGFMQDALAQLYFIERDPPLPTIVQCICAGEPGTIIDVGDQAQDTAKNLYQCQEAVEIGPSGSVLATFANVLTGPIPCPAGTLTRIYLQVPGWETITNPSDGAIGQAAETAPEFALRMMESVAQNSQGAAVSIFGALLSVAGVLDAYVYENNTASAVPVGSTSYSIAAYSIYVAVTGGSDDDVANIIETKKSPGCGMVGNTTVVVSDTVNYQPPYPTYNITFNRPTQTSVYFAVGLTNTPGLPANIVSLIQQAVVNQFTGVNGATPRARIGAAINATSYVAPIVAVFPAMQLQSVAVGLSPSPTGSSVTMGVDQEPVIAPTNVAVTLL